MKNKHQRKYKPPGTGIRFWRYGSGGWRWKRCSCKSRRTNYHKKYKERGDTSCVGPVSGAIDDGERHLIVPFSYMTNGVRSRGLRVTMEAGAVGRVCPASSSRSIIFSTEAYLLSLASLKRGRLAPLGSLRPSSLVKVK